MILTSYSALHFLARSYRLHWCVATEILGSPQACSHWLLSSHLELGTWPSYGVHWVVQDPECSDGRSMLQRQIMKLTLNSTSTYIRSSTRSWSAQPNYLSSSCTSISSPFLIALGSSAMLSMSPYSLQLLPTFQEQYSNAVPSHTFGTRPYLEGTTVSASLDFGMDMRHGILLLMSWFCFFQFRWLDHYRWAGGRNSQSWGSLD